MDPHQTQRPPPFMTNNTPHLPIPSRTASSTPISSPGLFHFSPTNTRSNAPQTLSASDASTPGTVGSPYLHPLQSRIVRETHKALVDLDSMTGRKLINQYEVIEELGRGVHGKVKLARNLENGESVAIKIIPRFSKKRRLGKVTAHPQDKTKREIAILKKIRHPNVVALLEIIDDPELEKIYVVLEHVELGEVVWRKKGLPFICYWERRMVQRGMYGELNTTDEEERDGYLHLLERRQVVNEVKRAKMLKTQRGPVDFWSIEYGAADEDECSEVHSHDFGARDGERTTQPSTAVSCASRAGSRTASITHSSGRSVVSGSCAMTHLPSELDVLPMDLDIEGEEASCPLRSNPGSSTALDRTTYGALTEDAILRCRSPSMADSIISHMSSIDFNSQPEDPFSDDFSYVPCFTIEEARATFRDTVLGLEYLHYEGVVHRDIKPANLLWTKDHRVKISDFGVSYFGRPIRDGEPDELVSESEAQDFDDDLELAKTVGTPAFFAPELCYTDVEHEQPKISEQIDVWSLGVTLYCLIFARIPFMAEDEFQMFKKIAKEDVYIPRRRLRPVDPRHSPLSTSFYNRVNSEPYRDDNVLAYEDIDDDLYDLLHEMLTKNPEKRIKLRDIKQHPWVVANINMPVRQWIDETDPSRRFSGRKIEVDEREIKRAVVPLTLMERARSAVKKVVNKMTIHGGRVERPESHSQSRRRATSSVASSAGETPPSMSPFPQVRDMRRRSIRPEDYFNARESDHPLSQSVSATPQDSPIGESPDSPRRYLSLLSGDLNSTANDSAGMFGILPTLGPPLSSTSLSSSRGMNYQRHTRVKSGSNAPVTLAHVKESPTAPVSSAVDRKAADDPVASLRKTRDIRIQDDPARSKSVDRGLFANEDKRAEPMVAISNTIAPGSIELPTRPLSVDPGCGAYRSSLVSPIAAHSYQYRHPNSDPNIHDKQFAVSRFDWWSLASHRGAQTETRTPPPKVYSSSITESFAQSQPHHVNRQQVRQAEEFAKHDSPAPKSASHTPIRSLFPADVAILENPRPPSRVDTAGTLATSASTSTGTSYTPWTSASTGASYTPWTSPSAVASPISIDNLPQQIFRSDPSLPALLSGASSVSADAEGDFLLKPGSLDRPSLIDTTDSLTPPALGKEPAEGFPLRVDERYQTILSRAPHKIKGSSLLSPNVVDDEEDSDTDSDGGLIMAKPTRRGPPKELANPQILGRMANPRRRDTQTSITSIGSTETAKKVVTAEP